MFDFTPPEVFRESKNLWFSNVIMWLVGRETKRWLGMGQETTTIQTFFDVIAKNISKNF